MAEEVALQIILCPIDFSPGAEEAMRYAFGLARRFGAVVHLVHADELPTYGLPEGSILDDGSRTTQRWQLEQIAESHRKTAGAEIKTELLHGSTTYDAIVQYAEKVGADVIVIGTHGRTGPSRLLLGSVAERVVRLSPVPVLTVPRP